ncbi:MAG: hypothetical protein A3J83_06835 [Elusimicrobia bacterium RIFOXYA2_FULL_40_6]|nr:MAG: hypothetical protein A3J83_06835 [Elusimicrobia bacterium RIFOXYA2_FULL_40_6]
MQKTKKIIRLFLSPIILFACSQLYAISISSYLFVVDGIQDNAEVVIQGRQPIFSWEYTANGSLFVSSFTLSVSTENALPFTSTVWALVSSTSSLNTANLGDGDFRTTIKYNSDSLGIDLSYNSTYYWDLVLYLSDGLSITISSPTPAKFVTIISSLTFTTGPNYDLQVDYNNPFNPSAGQITKFRYIIRDANRRIKIKIFNLSGLIVKTLVGDQLALKEREYTLIWDGKNESGEIVPSGIYFVNLDAADPKGITRRVIVTKK